MRDYDIPYVFESKITSLRKVTYLLTTWASRLDIHSYVCDSRASFHSTVLAMVCRETCF